MKIKSGATIAGLKIPMWRVIVEASRIWEEHGQELVITSGLDGTHSPRSAHPFGYALDLRTKVWLTESGAPDHKKAAQVAEELEIALGSEYRVIYEDFISGNEHIHVHWRGFYAKASTY